MNIMTFRTQLFFRLLCIPHKKRRSIKHDRPFLNRKIFWIEKFSKKVLYKLSLVC